MLHIYTLPIHRCTCNYCSATISTERLPPLLLFKRFQNTGTLPPHYCTFLSHAKDIKQELKIKEIEQTQNTKYKIQNTKQSMKYKVDVMVAVQFHTPTVTIFLSHKNLHKTICVATARIRPCLPTLYSLLSKLMQYFSNIVNLIFQQTKMKNTFYHLCGGRQNSLNCQNLYS